MTNKETITRHIGLTFDFVNHLIDNPNLIVTLPDKFVLNFIESDFTYSEKKPITVRSKKVKEKYVRVKNSFELSKS